MQEVFKDGSLGTIKDFELEQMPDALRDPRIDHVRIFERDNGNQVGIPQIEDKRIEQIIDKKLDERDKLKTIQEEYKRLTAEFDKKSRRFT